MRHARNLAGLGRERSELAGGFLWVLVPLKAAVMIESERCLVPFQADRFPFQ